MSESVNSEPASRRKGGTRVLGLLQSTMLCVVMFFLAIFVAFMACLAPPVHAYPGNSEAVIDCSRFATGMYLCDAIDACNRNHKLPRWRMDIAFRAVRKYLKCDLWGRTTGTPEQVDECNRRVSRSAARMNRRQLKFLGRRHNDFRKAQFNQFCGAVDFNVEFLQDTYGVGYTVDQQICDALGLPFYQEADLNNYAECGDTLTTRLHARLMGLVYPRTRELLEESPVEEGSTGEGDIGWCGLFPEERTEPVVCNLGFPPRPTIAPDATPIAGTRNIRHCEDQFYKRARTAHGQHFDLLEHCTEDHMYCKLKFAHGDISQNAYDSCIDEAYSHCGRLRETTDSHVPRDIGLIKKACGEIAYDDMIDVLGFKDIAADCGVTNTDDLIDCIMDQVKCLAWDVANYVEARLLDDAPPEFIADYVALCDN